MCFTHSAFKQKLKKKKKGKERDIVFTWIQVTRNTASIDLECIYLVDLMIMHMDGQ